MTQPGRVSVDDLASDLTIARQRGVDRLDIDTSQQPRRQVDHLERLAHTYCQALGLPLADRGVEITRLLRDGLAAYGEQGNAGAAALLSDLFFGRVGGLAAQLPGVRLRLAMKRHAPGWTFKSLRPSLFTGLATFLIEFVGEAAAEQTAATTAVDAAESLLPESEVALPEHEVAPVSAESGDAARPGRRAPRWFLEVAAWLSRRPILAVALVVLVTAGVVAVGLVVSRGGTSSTPPAGAGKSSAPAVAGDGPGSSPAQAGQRLTIYNKVTNGANGMREDVPVYLSAVARNFCKRDGCALTGTEMSTGAKVMAVCQTIGQSTTNEDETTTIDDGNPGRYRSELWYGVRWPDGRFGFVSEVWVEAGDRGGLGLSGC